MRQRNQAVQGMGKALTRMERLSVFAAGHDRLLLLAILLLALLLRILALFSLKGTVYWDFLLWDERVYHTWAEEIARGTFHSNAVYEFAPLPAYLMAAIYRLFSPDILYIRIFHIVLGVLTCHVVYLIGKELRSKQVGLLACLLAALYKPFIFYSIVPLNTILSVLLFGLTLYLLLCTLDPAKQYKDAAPADGRSSPPARARGFMTATVVLLGMVLGLILNVRPNSVVLIPVAAFFVLWGIRTKGKRSLKPMGCTLLFFLAGLSISIAPFVVRNHLVAGEPAVTTSQLGFNLYLGNNPASPIPYYLPVPFASSSPFNQGIQFTVEASRRAGKRLSSTQASSYWTREVLREAADHPGRFLGKMGRKTLAPFHAFEPGDHYHIGFLSAFARFFRIPFISLFFILPLGMAAMLIEARKGSPRDLAMAAVFFSYAATLILFFTTARYRLPLLTILIPYAAVGLAKVAEWAKTRRRRPPFAYAALSVAMLVVQTLPLRGAGDMTAYYNTHAVALSSRGLREEAARYWEISAGLNQSYSAFANLSLAGSSAVKGEIGAAMEYLARIPDGSFAAAYRYDLTGDLKHAAGDIQGAVAAYEKSLEINSGQRGTLSKLTKIYWITDRGKALETFDRLEHVSSFYEEPNPPAQIRGASLRAPASARHATEAPNHSQ